MRKKLYSFLLLLLILTTDFVFGKDKNKTKFIKPAHKKQNHIKEKSISDRIKRSLDDDEDSPFWANRGKRQIDDDIKDVSRYDNYLENKERNLKSRDPVDTDRPFWGNRGRRDSSSDENYVDEEYIGYPVTHAKYLTNDVHCLHCLPGSRNANTKSYKAMMERREELSPFWGNRGRRNSDETDDYSSSEPFWGNRGRRQENKDDPFWGTRGRKKDDSQFWGSRGRREDEPFWGNRGRREDSPFWGNRGRRDDIGPFWGIRGRRDDEPFWGNRGRRQENEPFWGHRGRREEVEPFWGNRGRRKDGELLWENRGRPKMDLKESILTAINNVEEDIENLSRLKRSDTEPNSFWSNKGRDSKLKYLFNKPSRVRTPYIQRANNLFFGLSKSEPGTVHDNRMYVDEPHYIVVERNSRSSGEEDPYYISRGKKYYLNMHLAKAARDRRGAIEEIVKSVRNDPYYIARGKKDTDMTKNGNATIRHNELIKVKNLICTAIDLIIIKNNNNKVKREIDNDRDRRTILKKLAAQLQIDPYFVSRGKKDDTDNKYNLEEFINDVAGKCNQNLFENKE